MDSTFPSLPKSITNPYKVLDILHDATDKDIRHAYRKKARTLHPDKNPNDPNAEEKFQCLQHVYEFLLHKGARKKYDETILKEKERTIEFSNLCNVRKKYKDDLEKREKEAQKKTSKENLLYQEDECLKKSKEIERKAREDNTQWINEKKKLKLEKVKEKSISVANDSTLGCLEISWYSNEEIGNSSLSNFNYEALNVYFSSFGNLRILSNDILQKKSIVQLESRKLNLQAGIHFLKNKKKYPFLVKFLTEIPKHDKQVDQKTCFSPQHSLNTNTCMDSKDLSSFESNVMNRLLIAVSFHK
jgi:curved DNA-binding protein CbpA